METKTNEQRKVRVTLYTYREGGSMVCDEQKMEFVAIPSLEEMRKLIEAYQEEIKYKGDVYFNISGRIEGEEIKGKEKGKCGRCGKELEDKDQTLCDECDDEMTREHEREEEREGGAK